MAASTMKVRMIAVCPSLKMNLAIGEKSRTAAASLTRLADFRLNGRGRPPWSS